MTPADGKKDDSYNPWPYYTYSGKLRPFPLSDKRTVPLEIGRPDYADHPLGYPLSEQAVKGSSQIKKFDDEEIEEMREVLDEATQVCGVGVTTDEIDQALLNVNVIHHPSNIMSFPNLAAHQRMK